MAAVSISGLEKHFGETVVLRDVDLEVPDGKFAVLVGPSGCGKSTLLRLIAGLEKPTKGSIVFGDRDVTQLEPRDRDVAMVFQSYALYPHLTVRDNLGFGLKLRGTEQAEIKKRVNEVSEMLGLEQLLARMPRELSGGQRQRVAMGRAIVRRPALFLFDEPLSNLDAALRAQVRVDIRKLHAELGTTSVYVTHDQVEAMTLADRVVVMNGGKADQVGAPLNVYRDPQTSFVAGFIGSPPMNFLDPAAFMSFKPRLPSSLAARLFDGPADRKITAGIRPEHLTLCNESSAMLTGRVKYAEPLGAETLVHLFLAGDKSITVRQDGQASVPETGADCHVSFAEDDVCLFDHEGRRVGA